MDGPLVCILSIAGACIALGGLRVYVAWVCRAGA